MMSPVRALKISTLHGEPCQKCLKCSHYALTLKAKVSEGHCWRAPVELKACSPTHQVVWIKYVERPICAGPLLSDVTPTMERYLLSICQASRMSMSTWGQSQNACHERKSLHKITEIKVNGVYRKRYLLLTRRIFGSLKWPCNRLFSWAT